MIVVKGERGERQISRRQGNQNPVLKEVCSSKDVCSPPELVPTVGKLALKAVSQARHRE